MRVWLVVAALMLVRSAGARAQPGAPTDESVVAGEVIVGVVDGDSPYDAPELENVLAADFAATHMKPRVVPLRDDEDLLARMQWAEQVVQPGVRAVFWVEPVGAETHRLFLFDPMSGRTWVRELPRGGDAEALLESLGIMIRLLAAGLDEGPPRGMEQLIIPESPPTPDEEDVEPGVFEPPPEHARPSLRWVLGAEYVGGNLGADVPWQSGVGLRVDLETPAGIVIRVRPAVLPRAHAEGEPHLTMLRAPVALEASYRFRRHTRIRPEVGMSGVIELMRWRASGDELRGVSGQAVRIALGPQGGIDASVWSGLGLHLHVRADIWLQNVDLMVDRGGERQLRLRPHLVGAVLEAGIHYAFGVAPAPRATDRRARGFLHPVALLRRP